MAKYSENLGLGDVDVNLVGDFVRGEFDVVAEGFLCFVAADVHHLEDSEFMGEVHVGYAAASGSMSGYAVVAWHKHLSFVVALNCNLSDQ